MQSTYKKRKALKAKMEKALFDDIKYLSKGAQDILLDDLVTAFESRLAVLSRVESNLKCFVDLEMVVSQ
jgi:hypothetical protein